MSITLGRMATTRPADAAGQTDCVLDGAAGAFGMSAAIAIVFNTLLAWVKDAYDPLNSFMAALTGHHWRTHGIVDVIVFVGLGLLFMQRHFQADGMKLAKLMTAAVVAGGGGLALWFLLV